MGDGVVNELIAFFVFLYVETVEKEKVKKRRGRGRVKKVCGGDEEKRVLTSVVTSRFRYSIHTRMGEFIDPVLLCYRYDGNVRAASNPRMVYLGARAPEEGGGCFVMWNATSEGVRE